LAQKFSRTRPEGPARLARGHCTATSGAIAASILRPNFDPWPDFRALLISITGSMDRGSAAARFGCQPATLRNWEQGRTRPDGPARVLLAVIARHPEAVEDALRIAS